MGVPLQPVDNLTIVFSDVSPDRSENWDIVDGEKWEYKRTSDASGRDKLTINYHNGKRREFELDERSDLLCKVVSFATLVVKGNVVEYTKVPF